MPPIAQDMQRALLYYESIVIHDPLAEYFREGTPKLPTLRPVREQRKRYSITPTVDAWASAGTFSKDEHDFSRVRGSLQIILRRLEDMRPAIEAGLVLPRQVWPQLDSRIHELGSSMRNDVENQGMLAVLEDLVHEGNPPLSWDNIRGGIPVPSTGTYPGDHRLLSQAPFLYLAKSLAIADITGSRYAPYESADFRLLTAKIEKTFGENRNLVSGEVIRSIAGLVLPEFDLPVKTLVAIRNNEEAFDAWRASVRKMSRDYGHLSGDDLSEAIYDSLMPKIREVDAAVNSGSVLGKGKSGFAELAFTVASGVVAGAVTSDPVTVAATTAAPAVAIWLYKMLTPSKPESGHEVLAFLRKQGKTSKRLPKG